MNDIDPKALEHACQCAGRAVHHFDRMALDLPLRASIIAHARAIEQHEAFQQEVSQRAKKVLDVAQTVNGYANAREAIECELSSLVIPKPDPLVEVMQDWWDTDGYANIETFRAAIEARGGRIVWEEARDV